MDPLMLFDVERVQVNARQASTEDLLDRVTVYRGGMEQQALDVIEAELRSRGVGRDAIDHHARAREAVVLALPDGTAIPCSFCHRPAVARGWGWHRLWGLLPIFPRFLSYCPDHRPLGAPDPT